MMKIFYVQISLFMRTKLIFNDAVEGNRTFLLRAILLPIIMALHVACVFWGEKGFVNYVSYKMLTQCCFSYNLNTVGRLLKYIK